MSYLDTLLEGVEVEWKTIDDLFHIKNGYTPSKSNQEYWTNGTIPWFRMEDIRENGRVLNKSIQYVNISAVKGEKLFPADSIIVSTSATIGEHALVSVPFLANQRFTVLSLKNEYADKFIIKFVFYYGFVLNEWCKNNITVGNFPGVDMNGFRKFTFPIPPLEVQIEIVRILDTFTELTARKKQYNYYREQLLSFDCLNQDLQDSHDFQDLRNKVEWKRLGELTTLITKGTTPKKYTDSGIAFIKTEVFDGSYINSKKLSFIDEDTHNKELKRSILKHNDILITIAGATIGKCAIVPKEILPANTNQALAIIRLNDDINMKYVFYLIKSHYMTRYIEQNIKGSAQPNLNLEQLNNFQIPYPSSEEQERIVSILDKFDTLTTSISEGLPKEIELRKKQYEYYRDKLLSFPV